MTALIQEWANFPKLRFQILVLILFTAWMKKTILACAAFITIDPDSFPVPATSSPSHSEKIRWITFCTGLNAPSSVRFGQNKKDAVCLNSPIYHIFLTGTAEVCTDQEPTAIAPIGGWIKRIFIQLTHHCYWEDLSVK